jgi:hypothetical protein
MDNKNELWYTQRTGWMKCKSRESDGKDHYKDHCDLKTIICGMKGFYYGSF